MGAESTFNQLPGWAKGVVVVAGTGAALFIGWQIYSAVKGRMAHAGDFAEKADVKDELGSLKTKGIKPSFSDSQYSAWANQLFTAMNGYTSDEAAVYRVFVNMKNNADVLKLIDAYGIRTLSSGNWNPAPDFKGTLSGALSEEFDTKEIAALNDILAKRKITIKF